MTNWYVRLHYTSNIFETFSATDVYLDFTIDLSTQDQQEAYQRIKRLVERDRYFDINKPHLIEVCSNDTISHLNYVRDKVNEVGVNSLSNEEFDAHLAQHPRKKSLTLKEKWEIDEPFVTGNSNPCSEQPVHEIESTIHRKEVKHCVWTPFRENTAPTAQEVLERLGEDDYDYTFADEPCSVYTFGGDEERVYDKSELQEQIELLAETLNEQSQYIKALEKRLLTKLFYLERSIKQQELQNLWQPPKELRPQPDEAENKNVDVRKTVVDWNLPQE